MDQLIGYSAPNDALSHIVQGNTTNSTIEEYARVTPRYWTVVLSVFVVGTLFGNLLVILAVKRKEKLQTVTNYLIVSLAVADLMVGALVMPLAVYVEVLDGKFKLHDIICDIWVAFDVMACTASIVNMTAISIDRFLAVFLPIFYTQNKNTCWYPTVMISGCWLISFGISVPIVFGANEANHGAEDMCIFSNPYFSVTSSIISFVVPTAIMIALYCKILFVLRQRAKAKDSKIKKKSSQLAQEHSSGSSRSDDCPTKTTCSTDRQILYANTQVSLGGFNGENGLNSYDRKDAQTEECGRLISDNIGVETYRSNGTDATNNNIEQKRVTIKDAPMAEVMYYQGEKDKSEKSNSAFHNRLIRRKTDKESTPNRNAIIMLMVVLCVFLCCWLPFFITNNVQVICSYNNSQAPGCTVPDRAMRFFVWLGYINSTLNPLIYAIFNIDYRNGFKELLGFKVKRKLSTYK